MALPEDLLEQSEHLARRDKTRPKQASLRRAISTAYYAVFHLLISDAVRLWRITGQRGTLARGFDHGKMKNACFRLPAHANAGLRLVAGAFVRVQQVRHRADYDNDKTWSRIEAIKVIDLAAEAFQSWRKVSHLRIAQDFLLSMLIDRK